ncbi:MAG: molybdate ABC transporter substrate-binding protein [Reichenbachiella sp.]|uniref:molybdate ABC transporter substrate-binding protein n=1 Tax=Reichenbachiella sp. TaxID=2184521 RepID=UPI0032986F06
MGFPLRILLCILLFYGSSVTAQNQKLRVAFASSLLPAMQEIQNSFESKYDINLELIPGASGTLTNQIMHGAPFDVFISANKKYSQLLFEKGLLTGQPINFIKGSLVIWSDTPLDISSSDNFKSLIEYLQKPRVQTIAMAQPNLAPYGDAAEAFLTDIGILNHIKTKLVYALNVSIANQYIHTRGANIVITSLSSQFILESSVPQYWYSIEYDSDLIHTLSRIKNENQTSNIFQDFLVDPKNKSIFLQYGYNLTIQ